MVLSRAAGVRAVPAGRLEGAEEEANEQRDKRDEQGHEDDPDPRAETAPLHTCWLHIPRFAAVGQPPHLADQPTVSHRRPTRRGLSLGQYSDGHPPARAALDQPEAVCGHGSTLPHVPVGPEPLIQGARVCGGLSLTVEIGQDFLEVS